MKNLLKKLKKGDSGAFDKIYTQNKRQIFYLIYSVVKNVSDAEDLLSEVFLKLITDTDKFLSSDNPRSYLNVVAKNMSLNFIKRRNHFVFQDIEETVVEDKADRFASVNMPVVDIARKILPDDEFQALILTEVAGYKRQEVAEMLNLSPSGVNFKRSKAIEKLKTHLEERP